MVFTLMDSAWGLSKMGALFGLVYVLPLKGVQKGIHIFDNLPCAPTQNNVVENHLLAVQLIRLPNVFFQQSDVMTAALGPASWEEEVPHIGPDPCCLNQSCPVTSLRLC